MRGTCTCRYIGIPTTLVSCVNTPAPCPYSTHRLTWHNGLISETEIWVKIWGDEGADTVKIVFQICNVPSPNSVQNTCVCRVRGKRYGNQSPCSSRSLQTANRTPIDHGVEVYTCTCTCTCRLRSDTHTSNNKVQKSLYNTHSYTVYMYMYMCMHIGGRRYVSSCQETMSFSAECTGSQEHKASKSADISQHIHTCTCIYLHVYTRDTCTSTYECTRTTSLPMVQHYL